MRLPFRKYAFMCLGVNIANNGEKCAKFLLLSTIDNEEQKRKMSSRFTKKKKDPCYCMA